tara:strand:+ start:554 stop:922 length:369 start_codon:yes stop_codon:yes gene_type:complete
MLNNVGGCAPLLPPLNYVLILKTFYYINLMLVKTNKKLPHHLIKYIMAFAEPTEEQMHDWKIDHYLSGWWIVCEDIRDLVIIVNIKNNAKKMQQYSLFSWENSKKIFNMCLEDSSYTSDEED